MRTLSKLFSNSEFVNAEVALNEIIALLEAQAGSGASSATLATVEDTDSSTTLLAANADRTGAIIFNNSAAFLYVAFAATASSSAFTYRVVPYGTLELTGSLNYTGLISGIWASDAGGDAQITEMEA